MQKLIAGYYIWYAACQLLQTCPTLCDPMDCSPPGSSVHGILQARILEWVTMPSSGSSDPGIKPTSLMFPVLAVGLFTTSTTWEARILLRPEEPGGLQPIGQQRVRHDWSNLVHTWVGVSQVMLVVKNPPANTGDIRTTSSSWIPGMGRSPGGWHGNPL